jgi:hypothetical protein
MKKSMNLRILHTLFAYKHGKKIKEKVWPGPEWDPPGTRAAGAP